MRTAFRTTSSLSLAATAMAFSIPLSALAIALAVSTTAALAEPMHTAHSDRSDCIDKCWRDHGKADLTQEKAAAGQQSGPADPSVHDKVAVAAPAVSDDPADQPADGPLKALDDNSPADPAAGDPVAVAAPAVDVAPDEDAPEDGPLHAKPHKALGDDQLALANDDGDHSKKKKSGPASERNTRGEHGNGHSGGGSGGGHSGGGGHNADGSPH